MRLAPKKNLGGNRSFEALERNSYAILCYAVIKPLFMDCGACRAIPEVNMLWLDAFGTPKNPGGVSELSGPRKEFLCYTMRCGEYTFIYALWAL